jgi:uncharacterized membrane protein
VMRRFVAYFRGWPAYRWVLLMAGLYFVAAFYGTWVNYIDLHFTTIGVYDLSINQQALASTVHGNYPYPFYEAANCGRDARCSFLQVHPVFLAYAVALPYGMAPSPATLFIIQDVGLAVAALPLFLITRELTKSSRLAILTAGIYLVWLPAFSGVFSFHWEAFLPIEIFTIFFLWIRGKYLLAVPVVIVTYVTLEIGSVFLFCLAAFFLLPWLEVVLAYVRAVWQLRAMRAGPRKSALATSLRGIGRGLFRPTRVRASFALLIGSVLAYVVLHEFVTHGGWLLGLPPLPTAYQIPLSQPVYAATFTVSNFLHAWPQKLIFWLVMFGTLAAIPLLAPRTVVLWGPWVAYTTVTTAGFYHMGNQYAFLAAAVIFPGFVYGLVRLQTWANGSHVGTLWTRFWNGGDPLASWQEGPEEVDPRVAPGYAQALSSIDRAVSQRIANMGVASDPSATRRPSQTISPGLSPIPPQARPGWALDRRRRRSWQIIGVVATGIVVFNLALNPLIPFTSGLRAQRPFAAQSNLGITGLPDYAGYNQVMALIGLIPSRAVVAVSPDLLTLVSTNPYAYPLLSGMNWPALPFNASTPEFVLLVVHGSTFIPQWLKESPSQLYTPGNLTVRAWAPSTYLGGMILFQRNYTGPIETFGSSSTFSGAEYGALSGIVARPAGLVATDASVPFGAVVTTAPNGTTKTGATVYTKGRIVQSPAIDLAPGTYLVTVNLTGSGTQPPSKAAQNNVSGIHLAAFELPINQTFLNYSYMNTPGWKTVAITMTLTGPVLDFQVLVTNSYTWFMTTVYSVTISPES